jgi:hypothetical protein
MTRIDNKHAKTLAKSPETALVARFFAVRTAQKGRQTGRFRVARPGEQTE